MARKSAKKTEFPLLSHVEAQMAKLHEHAPAALERFDDEGIHQARVATRRLKAAIDLMQPVTSKRYRRPVSDALRRLRRRLGPLRDADVMIDHLCELQKEGKHAAAAGWLRQRLELDRQRLRKASQEGPSADRELRRVDRWPNVRAEMLEAREAVDHLLAESLHLQTDAFAEQANWLVEDLDGVEDAADSSTEATSDATGDGQPNTPQRRPRQNPHDLRIAGKALRYTLEMAEAEGRSPGAGVMKQFKRMQEQLGAWHDYVVLADRAMQEVVTAELAHHDAAGAEQVIDLAKHAVRRSAADLAGFAKLWRQQGEKLAAKIRAGFPLTQIVVPADAARAPGGSAAGAADRAGLTGADDPGLPPGATGALGSSDACDAPPAAPIGSGTGPGPAATGGPEAPAAVPSGALPGA